MVSHESLAKTEELVTDWFSWISTAWGTHELYCGGGASMSCRSSYFGGESFKGGSLVAGPLLTSSLTIDSTSTITCYKTMCKIKLLGNGQTL